MIDRNDEGHAMGQSAHQYFIFETAGGFCGIAWSGELFRSASSPARPAGTSSQTR
jgi:methylated-DNA-[protein]-cysteine S-methyltransferase